MKSSQAFAARDRARYDRIEARAIESFDADVHALCLEHSSGNGTGKCPHGGASEECAQRKSALLALPRTQQKRILVGRTYRPAAGLVEQEPKRERSRCRAQLFNGELSLTRRMHSAGVLFMAGPTAQILPFFRDLLCTMSSSFWSSAGFTPMERCKLPP
jgi:hypothetical protein